MWTSRPPSFPVPIPGILPKLSIRVPIKVMIMANEPGIKKLRLSNSSLYQKRGSNINNRKSLKLAADRFLLQPVLPCPLHIILYKIGCIRLAAISYHLNRGRYRVFLERMKNRREQSQSSSNISA